MKSYLISGHMNSTGNSEEYTVNMNGMEGSVVRSQVNRTII